MESGIQILENDAMQFVNELLQRFSRPEARAEAGRRWGIDPIAIYSIAATFSADELVAALINDLAEHKWPYILYASQVVSSICTSIPRLRLHALRHG